MSRRRIKGMLAGESQEGDEAPKELNTDVALTADPDKAETIIGEGATAQVHKGERLAITAAFIASCLIANEKSKEHANRRVTPFFKPSKSVPTETIHGTPIPSGFQICPSCSTGISDPSDCGVCDCAGMIRIKDLDEDQSETSYD